MFLGERIKNLRLERGYDQKELGTLLNVNASSISNWETNRRSPDLKTLVQIADFFGVTTDYLLCRTDLKTGELTKDDETHITIQLDRRKFPNGLVEKEIIDKLELFLELEKLIKEHE